MLFSVNDRLIGDADDLHRLLMRFPADQPLELTVIRQHRLVQLQVPGAVD